MIGVDRDPLALRMAELGRGRTATGCELVEGNFAQMDDYATDLDGVVLDLGVSSMQLDEAARGFSFMKDGPLDMRMSQQGPTAADLVNETPEAELADILYLYGEERASRRIARAIIRAREEEARIETTLHLAGHIVERCLPRPKPGQTHPATRSFQAIRIAVNDEYGALIDGLEAAERALRPGGQAGGGDLPFHRGPDGQTVFAGARRVPWGAAAAMPPRSAARPAIHPEIAQGHRPRCAGAGREPARAQRQAAHRGAHRRPGRAGRSRAIGMPMLKRGK